MNEIARLVNFQNDKDMVSRFDLVASKLPEITDLTIVQMLDDQAEVLRVLFEKEGRSKDVIVEAQVFQLECKRRIGQILKGMVKAKGSRGKIQDHLSGGRTVRPPDELELIGGMQDRWSHDTTAGEPTLKDLGITKDQSSQWQKLAKIDDEIFEKELEKRKRQILENGKEINLLIPRNFFKEVSRRDRIRKDPAYSPIIKPSDNWNFSDIAFPRIDNDGHGYIPGDLYANVLWYWSGDGDVVYCPMAGSGQILRVWEERELWMRPYTWDINIVASDLTPRGPYKDQIVECDITTGACVDRADLIVMDLPYFKMVEKQYSDDERDIANVVTIEEWSEGIAKIASVCFGIQKYGDRVVTVCPNCADWDAGERVLTAEIVKRIFANVGYKLVDIAYSTRRIQQAQNGNMARTNNDAKERRLPLSDMAEVAVFEFA